MSTRRNFTVEDTSPLIQYTPAASWMAGNNADDQRANYSMGTYQYTTTPGSFATFSFNGTGVWVYGVKRNTHGPYVGTTDGVSSGTLNGNLDSNDTIWQMIYNATGLTQGLHTVTVTNESQDPTPNLSIDYIVYESTVADDSTVIFDDTNSQIQYNPQDGWNLNGCVNVGRYFGSTCHITQASSANVELNFQGDSVTVYGGVGPQYGPYSVVLNSQPAVNLTANYVNNAASVILYSATNLGPGNHKVTLTNMAASGSQVLDIDHFLVTGNVATSLAGTHPPLPKASVRPGPIVGAVFGAVALCCTVFALLWFFVLRHRQSKRRLSLDIDAVKEMHMENGITPFTLNMHNDSTSGNTSDFDDPYAMKTPQLNPANDIGRHVTNYTAPMTFPNRPDPPPSGLRGDSGLPGNALVSVVEDEKGGFARPDVRGNSNPIISRQRLSSPGAESNFTAPPPSYS